MPKHTTPPANPSENLFPYNVTLASGKAGADGSTYTVTSAFQRSAQTVTSPDSSPILSFGENFSISGESDTQEYLGTAVNSSGQVIGFFFEDVTTGNFFLFSTSDDLVTARSHTAVTVTLDLSTGVNDPNQDNWDLSTGAPVVSP